VAAWLERRGGKFERKKKKYNSFFLFSLRVSKGRPHGWIDSSVLSQESHGRGRVPLPERTTCNLRGHLGF
jgi:hypothetical protein